MSDGSHRPEPPMAAPPVEMLSAYLDFHRETLLWKMEGLTEDQLKRPMTVSGVSLLAILKHSAYVERWWFQVQFAGREEGFPWTNDDPNADWRIEPGETFELIKALHDREGERTHEILANAHWNEIGKGERAQRNGQTLGWILSHMLEEKARHNGQADLIREAIDGATGE
jgi:uncharacterized damage-inducible protein DinB